MRMNRQTLEEESEDNEKQWVKRKTRKAWQAKGEGRQIGRWMGAHETEAVRI